MPMNMNVCRAFSLKGSKLNVMSEFLRLTSTRTKLVFRPFYTARKEPYLWLPILIESFGKSTAYQSILRNYASCREPHRTCFRSSIEIIWNRSFSLIRVSGQFTNE